MTTHLTQQRERKRPVLLALAAAAAGVLVLLLMLATGDHGLGADLVRRAAGFSDNASVLETLSGKDGTSALSASDLDGFQKLLGAGTIFIPIGLILSISLLPILLIGGFGAINLMGHKIGMRMIGMGIGACFGMLVIGGICA